jgi:hypothetical protein
LRLGFSPQFAPCTWFLVGFAAKSSDGLDYPVNVSVDFYLPVPLCGI